MLASSIWGVAAVSAKFASRSMTVQVLEIISLDTYSQWDEVDSLGAPRSNGLRVSYLLVFSGPRLSSLMARTTFGVGSESPAVGYCPISANDDTVPLWVALSSDEAAYEVERLVLVVLVAFPPVGGCSFRVIGRWSVRLSGAVGNGCIRCSNTRISEFGVLRPGLWGGGGRGEINLCEGGRFLL